MLVADTPHDLSVSWKRFKAPTMELSWLPQFGDLVIKDDSGVSSRIEVVLQREERQTQTYFRCPITLDLCSVIYFRGGRWGSPRGLGLSYPSRTLSVQDKLDQKAGLIPGRFKPYDPDVIRGGVSLPRPRARRKPDNRFGSAAALEYGKAEFDRALRAVVWREPIVRALSNCLEQAGPLGSIVTLAPQDTLIWEDLPRLELAVVRAGAISDPTGTVVAGLKFSGLGSPLDFAMVFFAPPEEGREYIAVASLEKGGRVKVYQILVLTKRERGRRQFIVCPVTGKPVDTVGYRDQVWASREALKTTNRTQRSNRFQNAIARRSSREAMVEIKRNAEVAAAAAQAAALTSSPATSAAAPPKTRAPRRRRKR